MLGTPHPRLSLTPLLADPSSERLAYFPPRGQPSSPNLTRPPMQTLRSTVLASGLASLLFLSGCSSSGDRGADDNDMFIVTCTLGCSNGKGGEQVGCSSFNIDLNQEIRILFSAPVDLFTVTSTTFRVVKVGGISPPGQFFLDPFNPRLLIFRPALTFKENGTPDFGFEPNTAYEITIPGEAQGDPLPYIQSIAGRVNQSRLKCTIQTSENIIDPVPGNPNVQMFVDVVTGYDADGNPISFDKDVLIVDDPELIDVWRDSLITFRFNDIMNVATLLDPSTGKAPFIDVEVDGDGDIATLNDRFPVDGNFVFEVDQELLTTTLVFDADGPFPSAGPDAPLLPRRIAIEIPTNVQDLAGNEIAEGGGTSAFVPELSQFGEVLLPFPNGEDFLNQGGEVDNEDHNRNGADWANLRLAFLVGGGSGRLGDLLIPNGVQVILNTESQTFPLTIADGFIFDQIPDLIGNPDNVPPTFDDFPDSITVTDGVFEFSSLVIEAGGSLRLEGQNPARVYVRGPAIVQAGGIINVSGVTPASHDSQVKSPSFELATPVNAANGADGGFGADRFDMSINCDLQLSGNPENDPIVCDESICGFGGQDTCPPGGLLPAGRKGMGVGRAGGKGGGPGGKMWPRFYPENGVTTDDPVGNLHLVNFNQSDIYNPGFTECRSFSLGTSGGGAAYATDGGAGISISPQPTPDFSPANPPTSNNGPDTPGASAADVPDINPPMEDNKNYLGRLLRWQTSHLRGGAGGGGAGNHPYATFSKDGLANDPPICISSASTFNAWHDHSGARGGFGGGALHLASGRSIAIDGMIDASGGRGGRARQAAPGFDPGAYAMPGGGGSGGAIKLQSRGVNLGNSPGFRLDVSGGAGGGTFMIDDDWSQSEGGAGGTGLVRIEDVLGQALRPLLAPFIDPFEPIDDSLGWVSVDNGTNPVDGPGWQTPRERPGSISASSSCWLVPDGNFFEIVFVEDEEDENTGDPDKMGWNMDVKYDPGSGEVLVPFRGDNGGLFFSGNSWENEFGKELGIDGMSGMAAPIVVRFQGARASGTVERCDFDLNDPLNNKLIAGSVTPWVDHPALLNDFTISPNLVRFVIIFDATNSGADDPGQILAFVNGVTNFRIRALPD